MISVELISSAIGLVIGLVLAVTGAGGAMLSIPLLVLCLPISIIEAAPIALISILMASSIGAIQGLKKGTVRYKTALLIAITGMLVSPFGIYIAHRTSNSLLNAALSIILLWISFHSWKAAKQYSLDNSHLPDIACQINPATSKLFWTASCTRKLSLTGIISGFLSGLLGVGGGFIIVPSLNKVSNFNHQTVVATTLASVALISLSSIASHIQTSHIIWKIAIPFAISATISMLIISEKLNTTLSNNLRQKAFSALCLIAAIYLAIFQII
jgi:uncharacterized protein